MDLQDILGPVLGARRDPRVLVGLDTSDDAGVYQLTEDLALVQTVDFITPVVDDPFAFGQVAAANALSDVYAMGGTPRTALNICAFPPSGMPHSVLQRILEGGLDRIEAAGAVLVGGHSIEEEQLKYGLSVTGTVHPARIITNGGARPGDALILTKPLGTAAMIGGLRKQRISEAHFLPCLESMIALNRGAAEVMLDHGVHACTDITGYGLLGHGWAMARVGGVGFHFAYEQVPQFAEVVRLIEAGVTTRATPRIWSLVRDVTTVAPDVTEAERTVLHDPQTSGGLLGAVPSERADACVQALRRAGASEAARVGEVFETPHPCMRVTRR